MVPLLPGSEPIGLPAGANDVERAPACTGESEPRPLSPSVLPAQACPRPRLPSPRRWFDSLTIDNVWTCWQRAMSGEERDGRSSEDAGGPYTEAYKRERRRQGRGWVVLMAGVVIGATHVVIHLGQLRFLPSAGGPDLAVGYPMAMVLALVGLMMIASRTRKPRGEYCGLAPVICSAARGISSHRAGCQRHGPQQGHYW